MARRLNGHLKKSEIRKLNDFLLSEQERIVNKQLTKKFDFTLKSQSENKDDVDSANNNILASNALRFSNRDALFLKKIKKALKKFEIEEYGMCEECGCAINFQRLMARPTSEMCIGCKEESERIEGQSIRSSSSVTQKRL